MPTIYTDKERTERYDKLHIKKKRYERIYGIAMILSIFTGLTAVSDANNLAAFIPYPMQIVIAIAEALAVILSIYKHDLRISLPTTAFAALLWVSTQQKRASFVMTSLPFNNYLVLALTMLVVCAIDFEWKKLSQEEGFPLFEITMTEYEAREKNAEKYARARAEAAGSQQCSLTQPADMNDLLDRHEQPALSAKLTGYRSLVQDHAAAPQTKRVSRNAGAMDELILPPHDTE